MDANEVATLTSALPGRYADRLPSTTTTDLERIARGGETPELLDLLATALAKYHVTITAAEHAELAALLTACDMPVSMLAPITVIG